MIPFPRTVCACPEDVAFCKTRPGMLLREDITRIGEELAARGAIAHPEAVVTLLRASKGAIVWSQTRGAFRIGTITPRMENGRCVFLGPDDRCRIHEVAPAGCAYFDSHMSQEEGQRRSAWVLREIANDHIYQNVRAALAMLHGEQEPFEEGVQHEG